MSSEISKVEQALRSQRQAWSEVYETITKVENRELPLDPPKRILLFGVGSSFHAAKLSAYSLIRDRFRVRVPVIACQSLAIGVEVIPTKGDWVFGFSHRGTTQVTLDALALCDSAGAFTVIVGCKEIVQNGIPSCARFHLPTCSRELVEPHTVSLTSAVCAVTTLLSAGKSVEEWEALRSIGDPDLDTYRKRAGEGPLIILGEWEGQWVAREAALKLQEMARLPVLAFGSEEFFHGPKLCAGEATIWHVAHSKDKRAEEIKASHRVGIFGASPLAWVPALVELQWMALAVALNRGVNPDG